MRIVRYELAIQQYQQVQPLWPGRVLSVQPRRYDNGQERMRGEYGIDLYCFDNDDQRGDRLAPILGVWIIGTGKPIPQPMFDADALFHGTVNFNDGANYGVWHVFSAVVGEAERPDITPPPAYGSVDDMVERIKSKHARGKS